MSALGEKLRRLGQMSLPELRFRVARQVRIAREQWGIAPNGARPVRAEPGEGGAAAPLFYFCPAEREAIRATHAVLFPGRREEILLAADRICAHRFQIFAYPEVAAGDPIPWRRDLVHGMESGLEHWASLAYLDFRKCGDSKIVWEPNRHQHFFTLGQAWFLSGEARFAEECLRQLEHWLRENPPRRGINWASSLEAAFRAWSWLWAMRLLDGSPALTPARRQVWVAALEQHAAFIAENLSTYFSPNTHLLGEGFALFAVGTLLPKLPGAGGWRETGRKILLEEMEKQARPDGSHIEQAACYHLYAVEFFLYAAVLSQRNAALFPAAFLERLAQMVEYAMHISLPSGRLPMFGDADGGRVLAVARHVPGDPAPVLGAAAAFFGRQDFRAAAGNFREEAFWLTGGAGDQVPAGPGAPALVSRAFVDAGMVVMRSHEAAHGRMLLFDAGPQGMHGSAHGHCDALSIVCAADGIEWLTDPGTFVYTADRGSRNFFRSTRAHNTVTVDGLDQAVPVDVFKWRHLPRLRLERAHTSGTSRSVDFAVASHDGYLRQGRGLTHKRAVIFVKPDYWLVTDEFTGSGEHTLEFLWHFAPGAHLETSHGAWLVSNNGARFLVVPPAGDLEFRVACGEERPPQGWYSRDYGHRQPAPVLAATTRVALDAGVRRFHWLLWPSPAGWPRLRAMPGLGLRLAIETEAWTDTVALAGQGIGAAEEFSTDAELALLRQTRDAATARLAVVNGCCVHIRGMAVLRADSMMDTFEMARDAAALEIDARPARALEIHAPGVTSVRVNSRPVAFTRRGEWMEIPRPENSVAGDA